MRGYYLIEGITSRLYRRSLDARKDFFENSHRLSIGTVNLTLDNLEGPTS